MDDSELASAAYWAALFTKIENWAFLGVVVTLAIEFGATRLAEPHKEKARGSPAG